MNAHPDQIEIVRNAVEAMPVSRTLGLRCGAMAPGAVDIHVPMADAFTFRPGQLQATAIFAAADIAAVSAAGTLLPPGASNATIDTSLKIVAPANGTGLRARGRVVSPGKLLTVCASEVYSVAADGTETLTATLLATARNVLPK